MRAYRWALIVARRKGDPDIAAAARRGLRELQSADCVVSPNFFREIVPPRFDASTAVADLETMLRTARRQRAWVVEESLLGALVNATAGNDRKQRSWARALVRRYPSPSAFMSLAAAEQRTGRPRAARRALNDAKLLATRIGDHDARDDAERALAELDRPKPDTVDNSAAG
jgi:hypothetical protein